MWALHKWISAGSCANVRPNWSAYTTVYAHTHALIFVGKNVCNYRTDRTPDTHTFKWCICVCLMSHVLHFSFSLLPILFSFNYIPLHYILIIDHGSLTAVNEKNNYTIDHSAIVKMLCCHRLRSHFHIIYLYFVKWVQIRQK